MAQTRREREARALDNARKSGNPQEGATLQRIPNVTVHLEGEQLDEVR